MTTSSGKVDNPTLAKVSAILTVVELVQAKAVVQSWDNWVASVD